MDATTTSPAYYLIRRGRVVGVYTTAWVAGTWSRKLNAAVVAECDATAEEAQAIADYRVKQAELFGE